MAVSPYYFDIIFRALLTVTEEWSTYWKRLEIQSIVMLKACLGLIMTT